jgi:hypothetical protein
MTSVTTPRGCFGGCTFCSITAPGTDHPVTIRKSVPTRPDGAPGRLGGGLRHRRPDGQHVPDALHRRGRGPDASGSRATIPQSARKPLGTTTARSSTGCGAGPRRHPQIARGRLPGAAWTCGNRPNNGRVAGHHTGGHRRSPPIASDPEALKRMKPEATTTSPSPPPFNEAH